MEKTLILSVILLNGINLLKICGSFITSASVYVIWEDNHSPDELKEISDLFCPEIGSAFILNNSGKKLLFTILMPLVGSSVKIWSLLKIQSGYHWLEINSFYRWCG